MENVPVDHAAGHAAEARVTTDKASRYLQQLCKHFGHKVPARFDAHEGHVEFAMGACALAAGPEADELVMRVTASTPGDLTTLEEIVGGHLVRFGFRDGLLVEWQTA